MCCKPIRYSARTAHFDAVSQFSLTSGGCLPSDCNGTLAHWHDWMPVLANHSALPPCYLHPTWCLYEGQTLACFCFQPQLRFSNPSRVLLFPSLPQSLALPASGRIHLFSLSNLERFGRPQTIARLFVTSYKRYRAVQPGGKRNRRSRTARAHGLTGCCWTISDAILRTPPSRWLVSYEPMLAEPCNFRPFDATPICYVKLSTSTPSSHTNCLNCLLSRRNPLCSFIPENALLNH
jgi:hypothetical protein